LTRGAAAGERDRYHLDECGFAPTLPTGYTWAREGTRPLVPYEAPQGRRVNVIGALAVVGPAPRLVWASRRSGQGRLDSAAFLDFVCRDVAGLPATWDALPPEYGRARPCTIVLDNYSVHRSKAVQAAAPALARAGSTFYFLPPYSPKLSAIEPLWRHVKYTDLATRSFADGAALHDAVDAALTQRAGTLGDATHNLPRAA
jgi:DDE superfamily endonuclease